MPVLAVTAVGKELGKDAPYVPGWDCHGLPIEWKVEEEFTLHFEYPLQCKDQMR